MFSRNVMCLALCALVITGCVSLAPVAGGVARQDGIYLLQEAGPVQIEITRVGVGTQLGRVEVVLHNLTELPIEIDHTKTVIVTNSGEQLAALAPDQAATSLSTDPVSVAVLGAGRAQGATRSSEGEVMRNGLGRLTIEGRSFVKGAFFFLPPATPYESLTFTFRGIPGEPKVVFAASGGTALP